MDHVTTYFVLMKSWKNPENEFRKSEFQVKSVPTLTLWKSVTYKLLKSFNKNL